MKKELQRIIDEAWRIVDDRPAKKLEKLEALRIIAACNGVWIGDVDERLLGPKEAFGLRQARQSLVARALGRKAARTKQNRRAYLRKKIARLEALKAEQEAGKGDTNGTE
jgi:hypothetical protein